MFRSIIDRDYKFYGWDKIMKLLEQNKITLNASPEKLRIWSYDGLEMMEQYDVFPCR